MVEKKKEEKKEDKKVEKKPKVDMPGYGIGIVIEDGEYKK